MDILSREEKILGSATGDYSGPLDPPMSRIEELLIKLAGAIGKTNAEVKDITEIDFKTVDSLPATGVKGTIYLVKHSHGENDSYDEFIWTGDAFEKLGSTDINLTEYVKSVDLSKVAKSGSYNDLTDKPTIPDDTNTTYTLTQDETDKHKLVFSGSDGTKTEIVTPDTEYDDTDIKKKYEDLSSRVGVNISVTNEGLLHIERLE